MWHLFPFELLEGVVRLFMFGLNKYYLNSWKKLAEEPDGEERCFSAMMRHYMLYRKGEEFDSESKEHHVDAMIINLLFMRYCINHKKENLEKV